MRKQILCSIIFIVVVVIMVLFMSCATVSNPDNSNNQGSGVSSGVNGSGLEEEKVQDSESFIATFGNDAPVGITAKTSINADMTSGEMCLAAVENYYDASFVANVCRVGGVVTDTSLGTIEQGVQSLSYRDGKGDSINSNNANGAKYFAYSKSFGIANMCEEYYSTGDNVTYRKTNNVEKGTKTTSSGKNYSVAAASSWANSTAYSSIEEFIEVTSMNLTKIWAYKVDNTTILNYNEEVKENDGCYYFTIKLDKDLATTDYIKVMKYQLESNMGITVNSISCSKLELEFAVYANGFIKYVNVHETYNMNLSGVPVVGSLSMHVPNDYMLEYTFNKNATIPYVNSSLQEVPFVFDDVATF